MLERNSSILALVSLFLMAAAFLWVVCFPPTNNCLYTVCLRKSSYLEAHKKRGRDMKSGLASGGSS